MVKTLLFGLPARLALYIGGVTAAAVPLVVYALVAIAFDPPSAREGLAVLLFFALAVANEVVWRTQTTVFWGFYKFPGTPILIFLFAMTQAPLMMKHMPDEEADEKLRPPADAP